MKRLNKVEMIRCWGLEEWEADLVLKLNHAFPEMINFEEEIDDAVPILSARKLYEQLGYNLADNNFIRWIKRMSEAEMVQEEDYKVIWRDKRGYVINDVALLRESTQKLRGFGYEMDYIISIDFAKSIGMMTGNSPKTNQDVKENSKMIRNYFKLMEKVVKRRSKWFSERYPERENAKALKTVFREDWKNRHNGNYPPDYEYAREFDMLNKELIGFTAKEIRKILGITKEELVRDHLGIAYNHALNEIQVVDMSCIADGMVNREDRRITIRNYCKLRFKHLRVESNNLII